MKEDQLKEDQLKENPLDEERLNAQGSYQERVSKHPLHLDTRLAQAGNRQDKVTGAVSVPVHHSTTFAHPALGQSTGYDYSRTSNPTRQVLEDTIADLENGSRGFAFASGMAALSGVFGLFGPGDHLISSRDLYGGTYRLFEEILSRQGIRVSYVDTSNLQAIEEAIQANTKAIFLETPTNPTLKITDIAGCSRLAKPHGIILIVDNTLMTPYFQRPLDLGADIVVHSATKFLAGHNDVTAGLVAVRDETLAEQIYFLQNSIGAILGPQDSWLVIRGLKTLALRMARHQENAQQVAAWLNQHPLVTRVYYPGLTNHSDRTVHIKQASGFGGLLSFEVEQDNMIEPLLRSFHLMTFAESLGGTESLITFPARQTHFAIPKEVRESYGVTDRLLRISVGIEASEDLLTDLEQAFRQFR